MKKIALILATVATLAATVTAPAEARGWRGGGWRGGPGIGLGEREKATDRFYRGESARSTPGSGLGLSLVLAVARLHGGELRLEDNRPGLRAILMLPLPEDAARVTPS